MSTPAEVSARRCKTCGEQYVVIVRVAAFSLPSDVDDRFARYAARMEAEAASRAQIESHVAAHDAIPPEA